MSKSETELLEVYINNPDAMVWSGAAKSVSSENSTGPFDILPQHANFVTMIKNKPIYILTENKKRNEYIFKSAVISVESNKVLIYSGV